MTKPDLNKLFGVDPTEPQYHVSPSAELRRLNRQQMEDYEDSLKSALADVIGPNDTKDLSTVVGISWVLMYVLLDVIAGRTSPEEIRNKTSK